jgi:hypothetical protein
MSVDSVPRPSRCPGWQLLPAGCGRDEVVITQPRPDPAGNHYDRQPGRALIGRPQVETPGRLAVSELDAHCLELGGKTAQYLPAVVTGTELAVQLRAGDLGPLCTAFLRVREHPGAHRLLA